MAESEGPFCTNCGAGDFDVEEEKRPLSAASWAVNAAWGLLLQSEPPWWVVEEKRKVLVCASCGSRIRRSRV